MTTRTEEVSVGRSYGERQIDITPDLISRYREAVLDPNPWYSDRSPFDGAIAPALLLHSEVYHTIDWYLSYFGNLHAKQEWELFGPMMVGDTVTAKRLIVDRYVKRDREFVVNEVTVFGPDGTMLSRARTHQSFLLKQEGSGPVVDKERERRPDRRFGVEEGPVIEELSGADKEVTLEMCQKFSGPKKNYHTDVDEAKRLGFPDIVVQGMLALCFISEMMTNRFGRGWYVGGRMNVNLVNVLWRGETVRCRGAVEELLPAGPKRRALSRVWCEKADGTKVVVGTASALVD